MNFCVRLMRYITSNHGTYTAKIPSLHHAKNAMHDIESITIERVLVFLKGPKNIKHSWDFPFGVPR